MSASIGRCSHCRQRVPLRPDQTAVQHGVKAGVITASGRYKKDQAVCPGSGKTGKKDD